MPTQQCAGCGDTFGAGSPRARWCSEKVVPPAEPSDLGPLETVTVAELELAGRTRTVPGQVAVLLARRLDAATGDTGSSVAALAKQLSVTMTEALEGVKKELDPLDRIRAGMRERQLAAGLHPHIAH
jgi:hypothetical protein